MKKLLVVLVALAFLAVPALAHDESYVLSMQLGGEENLGHSDESPFKGWANFEVTNTGSEAWGDFHFEITGVGVDNVDFTNYSSSQSLDWVDIDNVVVGATLDMYFYNDPVGPGETATFSVYTDNQDELSFFGLCVYPTPVPEPATLAILSIGALLLRKRK